MLEELHTNQKLLVQELLNRGAQIKVLDKSDELLEVIYKGKKDFLLDRFSSRVPYHVVKMTADKHFAKNILRTNHISVPQGHVFIGHQMQDALDYVKKINIFPVVLKPNWGSHGNYVQIDIRNEQELEAAIWQFTALRGMEEPFIIEKFYPWFEHRLFVTSLKAIACVQRQPASVIGNGKDSIIQLIEEENKKRIELKLTQPTSICPIVVDKEVDKFLKRNNLSLDYIAPENEKIFLRHQSNLAKGGIAINMTEKIHLSVIEIAFKALACFPNLPIAGLDFLCPDACSEVNPKNYSIIEINSNPGLAMHTYPTVGQSINVASMVADVMFE